MTSLKRAVAVATAVLSALAMSACGPEQQTPHLDSPECNTATYLCIHVVAAALDRDLNQIQTVGQYTANQQITVTTPNGYGEIVDLTTGHTHLGVVTNNGVPLPAAWDFGIPLGKGSTVEFKFTAEIAELHNALMCQIQNWAGTARLTEDHEQPDTVSGKAVTICVAHAP